MVGGRPNRWVTCADSQPLGRYLGGDKLDRNVEWKFSRDLRDAPDRGSCEMDPEASVPRLGPLANAVPAKQRNKRKQDRFGG